ncbi:hypothetical protein FRC09_004040 [Ceratobasidium sp. 395]|nr:hypothetical protein FRC09_004040 [Ceratobasidium sp. 395]
MSRNISESSKRHQPISEFLELEQQDAKSFCSKWLWHPAYERSPYGGQIVAQALLSATQYLGDDAFAANSIQCHFLSGKTYRTLMVKGIQRDRWVSSAVCSFQRPELNQPSHSWAMPKNIPAPVVCSNLEDHFQLLAEKPDISATGREVLLAQLQNMKEFPIAAKFALSRRTEDGLIEDIFWMRLKSTPVHNLGFQKCVLAFISDFNILATVARAVRLDRGAAPPNRLAMISSLEHSVWFYDTNDVDCTEWMLFVMVCPVAGMGRGIVHGRIYTQQGRLIVMAAQEGVVRADTGPKEQTAAKL